ncbi:MAG: Gfo/Idh/MocA family oxidoreductase [Capsulimonadaceae bacterium]|nr:Gfo/Idh/MocA family oxidoreductase [Capsulimonadaceae bacterium]
MDDLKIGVIGAGGRGKLAGYAHKPGKGSRIVACCDVSDRWLDDARKSYGDDIALTHDYRELLDMALDAVFVTTPDFLHEEYATAALEAGKAVYLEKPMAITIAGCDRILEAARRTGSRLYLGHNMRHMPFVIKMKELIDSGAIGEVKTAWCRHFVGNGPDFYFKDWHAERRYSTSLLLQKAAHDIDVLHWLCGSFSRRVTAMGDLMVLGKIESRRPDTGLPQPLDRESLDWKRWPPAAHEGMNPVIDVEDVSLMLMQLDNGVLASYQQCHFTPDYWRNYTVIGSEGRIENDGNGEQGTTIKLWNQRHGWCPEGDVAYPVDEAAGGHGGADPNIVAEFVRFAKEGGATQTSPVAARNSVAAGCLAAQSLRNGSVPLDVPRLDDALIAYFDRQV